MNSKKLYKGKKILKRNDEEQLKDQINLINWSKYSREKRDRCARRVAASVVYSMQQSGSTGDPHLYDRTYAHLMNNVSSPWEYGWTDEQIFGLIGPVPLIISGTPIHERRSPPKGRILEDQSKVEGSEPFMEPIH